MLLLCMTEEKPEDEQENMLSLAHVIFYHMWEVKDERSNTILMKMPKVTQDNWTVCYNHLPFSNFFLEILEYI